MDIEIWDGGLQEQEIDAIKKIQLSFTDSQNASATTEKRGTSLRDQLKSTLGRDSIFPWKG